MPDETKPEAPPSTSAEPTLKEGESKVVLSGSTFFAFLFGVPIILTIVTVGVLNILAATGKYNPLHWKGRFWTGVFMLLAPTVMLVLTTLPAKIRTRMPDSVAETAVLLIWVAFFWAACGGH